MNDKPSTFGELFSQLPGHRLDYITNIPNWMSFYNLPVKVGDTIIVPTKEQRKNGIFCIWKKGNGVSE